MIDYLALQDIELLFVPAEWPAVRRALNILKERRSIVDEKSTLLSRKQSFINIFPI